MLYCLSDTHLSFTTDKPMNVFGRTWEKHEERIRENWKQIEEKMLGIPFGMKTLLSLQKKERYTMEDWYQIYENKMEKIYS